MCGLEGDGSVGDRGANVFKEGSMGVSNKGGWSDIEEGLTTGPSQML